MCLKLLNTSDLQRNEPLVRVTIIIIVVVAVVVPGGGGEREEKRENGESQQRQRLCPKAASVSCLVWSICLRQTTVREH